jgi:hypothetical protein
VTLLGVQEMNLGVREAILAEELECGMRHPDGRDLLAELDETHARVRGIDDDRATEAGWLSRRLVWVTGILVDLGLPPIKDIPQLLKTAQDALPTVALVLKRLQEALDSSAGPWD